MSCITSCLGTISIGTQKQILSAVDREDENILSEWRLVELYSVNVDILGDPAPDQRMKEDAMRRRGKERIVDAMKTFGVKGNCILLYYGFSERWYAFIAILSDLMTIYKY